MRILIFGSTGTFGTAVEKVCNNKGITCITLSHEDFEITKKEDLEKAIDFHNPDVVINAVAFVGINPCEEEPKKAFDINTYPVLHLANICRKKDIILIQPSTHAVFDGYKEGYYTEEDNVNPLSTYAISKHNSEAYAKTCPKHYVVRFPTLFGPRRNKSKGFVDKIIDWINEGREIKKK